MSRRFRTLALVLAGGKGSRLGPLTQQRAKPALPYAGVYRLVDFPLTNCVHSGLADVWVVEQFQPHALNEHLLNGRPWDLDRNAGGLRVMPPFTGGHGAGFATGNADVLWRHRALLREYGADEVVVMSADHVERVDLRDVLDAHREAGAGVTMVTTEVAAGEAQRFGLARVDGATGRVTDWRYKPDAPFGTTAATEVLAYDAATLLDTLEQLAGEVEHDEDGAPRLEDFGHHLVPAIVAQGRAHAWRHEGYWRDVGTVPSYWEGHMDLLRDDLAGPGGPLALDDPRWPLRTGAALHVPARLARSARVDDALVSPGCVVAGTVERSVLGPGVVVEEGAEVRDSVLLHAGVVRRGARVHRAVLDTHVEVGEGARVGAGGDAELTVVGRRARVEPGAELAAGAQVDAAGGPAGGPAGADGVDLGTGVRGGARA
jgi:glucose-1-phosphate adenylyltransferase